MAERNEKFSEELRVAIGRYLAQESNRTSLLTVTRVEMIEHGRKAIIYITIFPDEMEASALEFAKRKRTELHEYLLKKTKLSLVPFVDVVIDIGEKNRQRLDSLKV